jgi:hypothetical protein
VEFDSGRQIIILNKIRLFSSLSNLLLEKNFKSVYQRRSKFMIYSFHILGHGKR